MWRRKLDRVPSSFPCLYKKITFEQKSADELWPIEIRNFSWSNRDLKIWNLENLETPVGLILNVKPSCETK